MIRGADGVGPLYRVDFSTVARIDEVLVSFQLAANAASEWKN
jgi:hypothetical protein